MINNKLFYGPEAYVSLETAKLLKEAGFDWEIDTFYHRYYEGDGNDDSTPTEEFYFDVNRSWIHNWNNDALTCAEKTGELVHLSAPTLSIAQKWLREVKNIMVYVCPSFEPIGDSDKWILKYQVSAVHSDIEVDIIGLLDIEEECFGTYEEALEAGTKKCLELILTEEKYEKVTE